MTGSSLDRAPGRVRCRTHTCGCTGSPQSISIAGQCYLDGGCVIDAKSPVPEVPTPRRVSRRHVTGGAPQWRPMYRMRRALGCRTNAPHPPAADDDENGTAVDRRHSGLDTFADGAGARLSGSATAAGGGARRASSLSNVHRPWPCPDDHDQERPAHDRIRVRAVSSRVVAHDGGLTAHLVVCRVRGRLHTSVTA